MKNVYELAFIIKSTVDLDKARGILDEMLDYLNKQDAEVTFEGLSEKREMAYEIQKDKFGIYAVVIFKAEPTIIKELEVKILLDSNIIRHLVVSMEAVKADIDVSIANAKILLSGIVPKRAHPVTAKSKTAQSAVREPIKKPARDPELGRKVVEAVPEPKVARSAAEKKEDKKRVDEKLDKILKDEDIQ